MDTTMMGTNRHTDAGISIVFVNSSAAMSPPYDHQLDHCQSAQPEHLAQQQCPRPKMTEEDFDDSRGLLFNHTQHGQLSEHLRQDERHHESNERDPRS